MAINNGENALHGGLVGFDKVTHSDTAKIPAHTQRALTTVAYIHHEQRVWDLKSQSNDDGSAGVTFTLKAEDKEEGFPGNMSVRHPILLLTFLGAVCDTVLVPSGDSIVCTDARQSSAGDLWCHNGQGNSCSLRPDGFYRHCRETTSNNHCVCVWRLRTRL